MEPTRTRAGKGAGYWEWMKPEHIMVATLGGLALLGGALMLAANQVIALDEKLSMVLAHKELSMQELIEEVTRPDGRTTTVKTTRADGESEVGFVKRHDDLVKYLQEH